MTSVSVFSGLSNAGRRDPLPKIPWLPGKALTIDTCMTQSDVGRIKGRALSVTIDDCESYKLRIARLSGSLRTPRIVEIQQGSED